MTSFFVVEEAKTLMLWICCVDIVLLFGMELICVCSLKEFNVETKKKMLSIKIKGRSFQPA